jgi:hypothetical protein
MLEVIKHLFDIPKLVFVMSTDTKQLECSIKAVYGEKFDSEEYLSRFFQRRLTLSEPNYLDFIKANDFFSIIEFDPVLMYPAVTKDVAYEIVALFCAFHQVSLRRTEQLCARLDAALVNFPANTAFSFIELVGSIFSYELYPKLNLNYALMYRSGVHNYGGESFEVSYIGDPHDDHVKKALEQYKVIWDSLLGIRDAVASSARFADQENKFDIELNKFSTTVKFFEKCEYLISLIGYHKNSQNSFEENSNYLVSKVISREVNLLTGVQLEHYLHLFSDFS